ncbi:MAG: hypothetical protein HOQ36_14235, partial [Nocardia sp.]|nr:hypothetical protein [Nocardia sp.]
MTGQDAETISVMVVDDHPIWREGVSRDLTEAGFRVVATAESAAAAGREIGYTRIPGEACVEHVP